MISLVLCSYRPGGFDVLMNSFLHEIQHHKVHRYELLVIDDYPGRTGRGAVPKFLLERGVNLTYYSGSKHKSDPTTKGGLMNAYNTALMNVRSDFVVFICDYTYLPPQWVDQWQHLISSGETRKSLISGGGIVYHSPRPDHNDDIYTWKTAVPVIPKWPWVPYDFETFYYGAHMDYYEAINGVDERADHCHCWPVSSTIAQAKILGYELKVFPELACHLVDHRTWDTPEEPNPVGADGLWKISHGQSLREEPTWVVPSPNPFNLKEVRQRVLQS